VVNLLLFGGICTDARIFVGHMNGTEAADNEWNQSITPKWNWSVGGTKFSRQSM
jgi:hypothetical protein